jgi:ISXO2-like transposase domain
MASSNISAGSLIQGFMLWDEELRPIELFAEQIIPHSDKRPYGARDRPDSLTVEPGAEVHRLAEGRFLGFGQRSCGPPKLVLGWARHASDTSSQSDNEWYARLIEATCAERRAATLAAASKRSRSGVSAVVPHWHIASRLAQEWARLVVGAVEIQDGGAGPGRIRLQQVPDYSAQSLHAFVAANLAPGATAKTDGWSGYPGAPDVRHDPHVVGNTAAHIVLPWSHRRSRGSRLG